MYLIWQEIIMTGTHNIMWDDVIPYLATCLEVISTMLQFLELDYSKAVGNGNKSKIAYFEMFSIAGYLGGEKIVELDLFGLNIYFVDWKNCVPPFVHITLISKFKCKTRVRHHILRWAWITNSGIQCGKWKERFLEEHKSQGRKRDWVFVGEDGRRCQARDFELELHHYLEIIQSTNLRWSINW